MRNEDHVVGVYGPERRQTITHNGEKGDQNAVNDVNDVDLPTANIDPTDQEEDPGQTEQGDQSCVQSDKESKCCFR
jgi:hypothetical protein